MNILYMSDGEMTAKMTLRQLFANFTETETKHYPEDIETELASRGWYENLHECGHYLVLNLDKLPIEYLDPDNYADVLAILAKNDGACPLLANARCETRPRSLARWRHQG